MIHTRNEQPVTTPSGENLVRSFGVSRETIEKLKIYEQILRVWQARMNLISNSSLDEAWVRHFADSLQLLTLAPDARTWVDLGSGAGFPGLPIAMHISGLGTGKVHLIERDHRKCAFLREVSRATGAAAEVHHGAIEDVLPHLEPVEIVTSRAVAPLRSLIEWSRPLLENGSVGYFLKGQDIGSELTSIAIYSKLQTNLLPSLVQADGCIVAVWAKGNRENNDNG